MSWLQQRPQTSDPTNFYQIGVNKNILLVGLGNPGKQYTGTRHNIGFECLDEFVAKTDEMADWINKKDLKCEVSTGRLGQNRVIAIKPTTFMNLSGEAVAAVCNFYKISADQITVIHDELDVDFDQIRLRTGGSSAGHNGIKSVSQYIGEGYGRIRIGIGPKHPTKMKSEDFVLQKFSDDQAAELGNLKREVLAILNEYIYGTELPHETRTFVL